MPSPRVGAAEYMSPSDLDLESMTILSTRVSHGLTKLNTMQAGYELVFLVWQACIYGYGRN